MKEIASGDNIEAYRFVNLPVEKNIFGSITGVYYAFSSSTGMEDCNYSGS